MVLNSFIPNEENNLMSIDELKAFRLRKKKIDSNKKARRYIYEINQRYRKMSSKKGGGFLKNINPFKRTA